MHERIEAAAPKWLPASVLFLEIQQKRYNGGIAQLRRFIRPLKETKSEPLIRFETLPGEQMQIDFTTIRRGKHPVKAFVATLGYSRACYVRFDQHEQTDNWLDGIVEACHFFGGVPKEVLCDNAKALVIKHDGYGKGEVERFNHYLKNSFVLPHAVTLKQSGPTFDCDYGNASVGY
ncbi:DDE-type integrase/transposase/recombinase [Vibrio parahaemolyticus]|nr:DDE-type integrase/transposase/recombinase [Vibrio parahaemolyticus]